MSYGYDHVFLLDHVPACIRIDDVAVSDCIGKISVDGFWVVWWMVTFECICLSCLVYCSSHLIGCVLHEKGRKVVSIIPLLF